MISFKDIKLTEQKNTIYIPQHLKWTLENFLKRDFPDMESDAIVAVNIGMLLEDELREIKSVAENASMRELILKINNILS